MDEHNIKSKMRTRYLNALKIEQNFKNITTQTIHLLLTLVKIIRMCFVSNDERPVRTKQ